MPSARAAGSARARCSRRGSEVPAIKRTGFRGLIWVGAALVVLAVIVAGALYWIADRLINGRDDRPLVLAAPPESLERRHGAPYDGPHPRLIELPAETFPFPLRPGQVGPVAPLFAGELKYPLLCRIADSDLGQPLVDNGDGHGMAVFGADGEVAGYSKDCLLPTRIEHWYLSRRERGFAPFGPDVDPDDLEPGEPGGPPLVVRVEIGTINRYIYLIALRVDPAADRASRPDFGRWNRRLIYYFRGGVGIGYRQGRVGIRTILKRRLEELSGGYAVAYSSGNQTSNTYDIWLNADTALRVKRQFTAAYGEPVHTIGIGGSGGAIQQYLIAQNFPGILDASVALYSYPDMVTQSTFVLDCELLEHYFDRQAGNPRWADVAERRLVLGGNANPEIVPDLAWIYRLNRLAQGRWPAGPAGATACAKAWRGATPLVINPTYAHFSPRFAEALRAKVDWTYYADLKRFFGTDAHGFGRRAWDNVGVQYGLEALRAGNLTPVEFLDLNARVGGWKQPAEMTPPRYWLSDAAPSALADFSPWGEHNMNSKPAGGPAPRSAGDGRAIAAAYRSGQVFLGLAEIPIVDLRHYLEDELDMHHTVASFQARARMIRAKGNADNQLIWITRRPHAPYAEALDMLERWLAARAASPDSSAAETRPADATDRCYDSSGAVIAAGEGVWDGAWNGRPDGACTRVYPPFSTSRIEAGDDFAGDRFKCALQPVAEAIERGVYAPIDMRPHRVALEEVFPDGVCDYTVPDPALPRDLIEALGSPAG